MKLRSELDQGRAADVLVDGNPAIGSWDIDVDALYMHPT